MDIYNIIEDVNLNMGDTKRMNCPSCNGYKTFSITNNNGKIVWNCFKASCNVKGTYKNDISSESFSKANGSETISHQNSRGNSYSPQVKKVLQRYWRGNDFPIELINYLTVNHCLHAYQNNSADIRYDYQKNRAVFVIKNHRNEVIDGAGRALYDGALPKWFRYGSTRLPYVCGDKKCKNAVVVEDCASACAVTISSMCGVALMGTNLLKEHIPHIVDNFKLAIVALDKDASQKSLDIAKELSVHVQTQIRFLDKDIKTWTEEKILGEFNE